MIGGECVRLTQGDYTRRTTYYKDPLEVAKRFEDTGVRRLHLVDLDGAKESRPAAANLKALERIATRTQLDIQYGGGIKEAGALDTVFDAGANRAICGSVAVRRPDDFALWLQRFGPRRLILGADIKEGKIAIHGWLESSEVTAEELIASFLPYGLSQVICTDVSKDGMLQGPTFELYTELQGQFPAVDITVSGGISSVADLEKLNELGLRSVVVGKAIYEGRITMDQLAALLRTA